MTTRTLADETEIPLFLVPNVIARQIKDRGDAVYRISVKRTHWHHYNVSVRTKRVNRELKPQKVPEPADKVAINYPYRNPGDESSRVVA